MHQRINLGKFFFIAVSDWELVLHFSANMLEKTQVNPLPITAYLAGN